MHRSAPRLVPHTRLRRRPGDARRRRLLVGLRRHAKSLGAPRPPPSAKKSEPTVEAAKFASLPDPCASIGKKTIEDLVPKAKNKAGTPGKSSDTDEPRRLLLERPGRQRRQGLAVPLARRRLHSASTSDQSLGSGAKRATAEYTKQVAKAQATEGAKKLSAEPVTGLGEQATSVTYDLKKSDEDFEYATIVTRTENVVVTLTYNGGRVRGRQVPLCRRHPQGREEGRRGSRRRGRWRRG